MRAFTKFTNLQNRSTDLQAHLLQNLMKILTDIAEKLTDTKI